MDNRIDTLKCLKKESRQEKRRYVTRWKALCIFTLVLALVFAPLSVAVRVFDNAVAARLGGKFWALTHKDDDAVYYQQEDELAQLDKQAAIESAVLLKNENSVLPLGENDRVSCFSVSSVNLLRSDGSRTQRGLKDALEQAGFRVNETLWDFYRSREIRKYAPQEAPYSLYTGEVFESVRTYSDAAIVVLTRADGESAALTQEEKDLLEGISQMKQSGSVKKIIVLLNTEISLQADFSAADAVLHMGAVDDLDGIAELLAGKQTPSGRLAQTYSAKPLGYKYFESHYADFVTGTGDYNYSSDVTYPFGSGLSYTTFAYSDMSVTFDEKTDRFTLTLTVTNTGAAAGKEVVQVYAQAPYTDYDREKGVEKPAVKLVGFAKTDVLQPGGQETVTVLVDRRELASYDAAGAGTYILEAGSYYLTVAADAHTAVNNILAAKGHTRESTENRMDTDGNVTLTYTWEQDSLDMTRYSVSRSGAAVANRFAGAPKEIGYRPSDYATVPMPTMGAQNNIKLQSLIGLSFDDPMWQTLLDQLTFAEMVTLVGDSYRWCMPVESVQAPGARWETGRFATGAASTFNTDLLYELGKVKGNLCLAEKTAFFLGADIGIFEDAFLTGKCLSAEVQGMRDKGINVVLEALETSWLNEQAAREQYLKPLQYTFEEGRASGIAVNTANVDGIWAGAHTGLLQDILRTEWGSEALVLAQSVPEDKGAVAGGVVSGVTAYGLVCPWTIDELKDYENDPVVVTALRQACHRTLYAVANSAAMNGVGEDTKIHITETAWVYACVAVAIVALFLSTMFRGKWRRGVRRWKRTQAYLDWKTLNSTLKEEKK